MIVTEENRDLGYSSQDSDHVGSDTEYEYDPTSDEDTSINEITESFKDAYIERAPMRCKGVTHNRNYNISRPQANNFHSGGGIINTSSGFNSISVPNQPTTHTNNFGQHFNIIAEPEVLLVDKVNQDETSQDDLSSNKFYIQTINESFDKPLAELNGDLVLSVLQELDGKTDDLVALNNNQNYIEGKDICAFSNIPSTNPNWSSHRIHTQSYSTTSTTSSLGSPAEYSPLSITSTSDIPQSSDSLYSSDDPRSCQSTPDLSNHFTPTLNDCSPSDNHLLIPKTVNDAEERCSAKELVQKVIKQYPKERKRVLWVQASKKTPSELMIDIRALVESNIGEQLEIRLYAVVEVFLKNASLKQCKEVFKKEPTISGLLERKQQRLLKRYIDEIVQDYCMDD